MEYLHLNIMQEQHILKENDSNLSVSYIGEICLDPFTHILSNLLLQMSKSHTLNIYIYI